MYISTYGLNWHAEQVSLRAITVSVHTAEPGDDGTANELQTGGGRAYARAVLAAANTAATADTTDNDDDFEVFTPNATDAGGSPTATHIGYWFGANFYGWVPMAAGQVIADGVPFTLAAGTMDIRFALGT